MRQGLLRSAAVIAVLAIAAPASAQWAVIDSTNLIQNVKTAIQTYNQLIEMKKQGLQIVANAKRFSNLDGMLSQVERSATTLATEGTRSTANGLYALDPGAANVLSTMRSTLNTVQGFPSTPSAALAKLTTSIGPTQGAATLQDYSGMYARADNALNMSRSIADVEKDRAALAQSLNDYATEGHNLGSDNLSASVQHLASGNLLNGRIMNKMLVAQNLTAQQNQDIINRDLAQESARLESQIADLQAAKNIQNFTITHINASTLP